MRAVSGELEGENGDFSTGSNLWSWKLRTGSTTLVRGVSGDLENENWLVRGVSGELEDENWRLCSSTLVRGGSGELEDENWRLSSTTLVRGAICGAGR